MIFFMLISRRSVIQATLFSLQRCSSVLHDLGTTDTAKCVDATSGALRQKNEIGGMEDILQVKLAFKPELKKLRGVNEIRREELEQHQMERDWTLEEESKQWGLRRYRKCQTMEMEESCAHCREIKRKQCSAGLNACHADTAFECWSSSLFFERILS